MGVLDDAIREHLDLKRRRGADPTEVERAERDALGPVRRVPERVPGDDSELEPSAPPAPGEAPAAAYDDEAAYEGEPVYADEPAAGSAAHELDHAPAAYDQATAHEPAFPEEDEPSWNYDAGGSAPEHAAEPERAPEHAAEPPHDHADHTAEYDVEEALGAEPPRATEPPRHAPGVEAEKSGEHAAAPGDEDVLEETPEFLQDTPDHDRLWFEQRPPRDFDFEG